MVTIGCWGFLYNQWTGHLQEGDYWGAMIVEADEYVYSIVIFSILASLFVCYLMMETKEKEEKTVGKIIEKDKLFKIVGRFSYPLYLFHYPIIVGIRHLDGYYGYSGNRVWETLVALTSTIAISSLVHSLIEETIGRFADSITIYK